MPTYTSLWPTYAKQWDQMVVKKNFTSIAKKLIANKERYLNVERTTGVPWFMVALLHLRESDCNFNTQLAQGDPLSRKSTHVPRGRGPFPTWDAGAYDALITLKGWDKVKDWRLEKILYYAELYNGWGYHNHGVPSAYLWAGSSIYRGGKYVADGVWSSTAQDTQPGVASVLKTMMDLDPTIKPKRETNLPDTPTISGTGVVVAGGAAATAHSPHLWPYILGGTVLAIILGYITYKLIKKDRPNV